MQPVSVSFVIPNVCQCDPSWWMYADQEGRFQFLSQFNMFECEIGHILCRRSLIRLIQTSICYIHGISVYWSLTVLRQCTPGNPSGPHQELFVAGPCDHGRGHVGNGASTLGSKVNTTHTVFICFQIQLFRNYHQVRHSLNVSFPVIKMLGPAQCWFWWELSQEVNRDSKYFLSKFWSIHWHPIR